MKLDFKLTLGPLDRADALRAREWRNDYKVWRWCRQNDFISDSAQAAWYDRQTADPSISMYSVLMQVQGHIEMVGVAGLTSICHLNRRAEFSLYIRPDFHSRGLGREALKLLLAHGFHNLGLSLIWGESIAGNPAIKMFASLGFQLEGTRRRFYFKDGAWHDAALFSMTREEFDERFGTRGVRGGSVPESGGDGGGSGNAVPGQQGEKDTPSGSKSADVVSLAPKLKKRSKKKTGD